MFSVCLYPILQQQDPYLKNAAGSNHANRQEPDGFQGSGNGRKFPSFWVAEAIVLCAQVQMGRCALQSRRGVENKKFAAPIDEFTPGACVPGAHRLAAGVHPSAGRRRPDRILLTRKSPLG
jgi:hypothetical protein